MTSRHYTNNNTVSFGKMLAEALRRGNWMIALSALASFLAGPVCFLFVLQSWEHNYDYAATRNAAIAGFDVSRELAGNMADYLTGIHAWLQLMIVVIGAVIVSVFGFRYLYHRRSADLYGSMPVTRGRQFLAQYLAGFLIWFVPFLIGNTAVLLIAALRGGGYFTVCAGPLLRVAGLMLLNFLIVYNACLVAVQLSGNTINALLNAVLYGITMAVVYLIYVLYCTYYFETFYLYSDRWTQLFIGLSPLISPVALTTYLTNESLSEYLLLLIVSLVLMLLNLILAKRLHDLRPGELAEHGLEWKPVRIPLRAIISVGSGLLLGMFFSQLADDTAALGWTIFGCLFGTVLAFAVLNVIYHASFRELFAHRLQLALCAVVTLAILFAFREDVFGYDTYVAKESRITGLAIEVNGLTDDGYRYVWDESEQYYTYSTDTKPEAIVSTDSEKIYQTLVTLTDETRDMDASGTWIMNVRVFTKTGIYSRTYRIYRSDLELIKPLLETDAYRDAYYPASQGNLNLGEEAYSWSLDGTEAELYGTDVSALYQAYIEDFRENYSADMILAESRRNNYRSISFYQDNGGYVPSLAIYPGFTRTLSFLEEKYPELAWTEDDLEMTELEIYVETEDAATCEEAVNQLLDTLDADEETRAAAMELVSESDPQITDWSYVPWGGTVTDPALLAELEPILYLEGYAESENRITFGSYSAKNKNTKTTNETWFECYVEPGTVPGELILAIIDNTLSNVSTYYEELEIPIAY